MPEQSSLLRQELKLTESAGKHKLTIQYTGGFDVACEDSPLQFGKRSHIIGSKLLDSARQRHKSGVW